MRTTFLKDRCIGISISESPDMAVLGLGVEHLQDAMAEIARHIIACGGRLAYGGDLREDGFTELLFELVDRYRPDSDHQRILIENYLAWPVHALSSVEKLHTLQGALKGLAELVLLKPDGKRMELSERAHNVPSPQLSDWAEGLTAMRAAMASKIDARIALGGKTADYKGRMPGIAEEALIQIERKSPLFLLGGFGGCSLAIAQAMRLHSRSSGPNIDSATGWAGLEAFKKFRAKDLRNGLTQSENRLLAATVHIDEAAALILRGLMKLLTPKRRSKALRTN
jgi:hypothetical protein